MIASTIITYDARQAVLEATLQSLKETDWPWDPIIVNDRDATPTDEYETTSLGVRQANVSLAALKALADTKADWCVFMENDLIFNKNIYHNICRWEPFVNGSLYLGSMYLPSFKRYSGPHDKRKRSVHKGKNWFAWPAFKTFGSQFYLMSRPCVLKAISKWDSVVGFSDGRIRQINRGVAIYYHTPSLVQHRAVKSTWGGKGHKAFDFDINWKKP